MTTTEQRCETCRFWKRHDGNIGACVVEIFDLRDALPPGVRPRADMPNGGFTPFFFAQPESYSCNDWQAKEGDGIAQKS